MNNLLTAVSQNFTADRVPSTSAMKAWDFSLIRQQSKGWNLTGISEIHLEPSRHCYALGGKNLEPKINRSSGRYESQATLPT